MAIEIKIVQNKSELKSFIMFPWDVYRGDSNWVPPLIADRKKILSKEKNPFFEHAEADYFLAYKNGKLMGRIAGIVNHLHNQIHEDKVGFFGFFECFNDQEVASALFDAANTWLKQRGMLSMRGPANPSVNDEYGMLIDGFDDPPRLLMTYNPEYYTKLCDDYGFVKAKDLFAYSLESDKLLATEKLKRGAEIAAKRAGMTLREINMKDFPNELKKIKVIYNKAWEKNWGFVPLTDKEMDALAADLKPLIEPGLVLFGEVNGEPIGFSLTMLDYNQIFKNMNGRLFPNIYKLWTQKKNINWARVLILGLIPEYQKRGLDAAFYWDIMMRARKVNIMRGEASWILEDNLMMNRGAELMKGDIYKKYRIYEKPV